MVGKHRSVTQTTVACRGMMDPSKGELMTLWLDGRLAHENREMKERLFRQAQGRIPELADPTSIPQWKFGFGISGSAADSARGCAIVYGCTLIFCR